MKIGIILSSLSKAVPATTEAFPFILIFMQFAEVKDTKIEFERGWFGFSKTGLETAKEMCGFNQDGDAFFEILKKNPPFCREWYCGNRDRYTPGQCGRVSLHRSNEEPEMALGALYHTLCFRPPF